MLVITSKTKAIQQKQVAYQNLKLLCFKTRHLESKRAIHRMGEYRVGSHCVQYICCDIDLEITKSLPLTEIEN